MQREMFGKRLRQRGDEESPFESIWEELPRRGRLPGERGCSCWGPWAPRRLRSSLWPCALDPGPSGCPAQLVDALRLGHLRVGRRHAAVHPLRPPRRGLLPPGRLHPMPPAGLWQPPPPAGLPHLPARAAVNSPPAVHHRSARGVLTPPVPAVWFRPRSRGHPGSERPRPASHP